MLWDITGPVYTGMWGNGEPFPDVRIRPVPQPEWLAKSVYCEIFDGMHSQTGTYLETPAHWFGSESYNLSEVPLERLTDIPATVLKLRPSDYLGGGRRMITRDAAAQALDAAGGIHPGEAILISTGHGAYWRDARFTSEAPYFSRGAMELLIRQRPFLLGADSPIWESRENPQGFFADFYAADILMLAPVILTEELPAHVLLTALPLRVEGTSCAPCRAFLRTK